MNDNNENLNLNEQENINLKIDENKEKALQDSKQTNSKFKGSAFNVRKLLSWVLCVVVCVGAFIGGYFTNTLTQDKSMHELDFLLRVYNKKYYQPNDKNPAKVLAEGLLDRYSEYYTPEEMEENNKNDYGSRMGIGISFYENYIYKVIGNSPADRAGIKEGGLLKGYKGTADGEYTVCEYIDGFMQFVDSLNAEAKIYLLIEYDKKDYQYIITKQDYLQSYFNYCDNGGYYSFWTDDEGSMKLVKTAEGISQLDDQSAYVKYSSFSGLAKGNLGSVGQFESILKKFNDDNKTKIIIDLRSNGGGFVSIMGAIACYLCDGNEITCMVAKDRDNKVTKFIGGKSLYKNYNFKSIVFLADVNSASASEALIGCCLDYDKNSGNNVVKVILSGYERHVNVNGVQTITTEYRTYGKGIMQDTFTDVTTGAGLKLTTAKIYWPISNTCIHDVGITTALNDDRIINGSNQDTLIDAIEYLKSV